MFAVRRHHRAGHRSNLSRDLCAAERGNPLPYRDLCWFILASELEHAEISSHLVSTFLRADFAYDKEHNLYICPGGKALKTTGKLHDGKTLYLFSIRRIDTPISHGAGDFDG